MADDQFDFDYEKNYIKGSNSPASRLLDNHNSTSGKSSSQHHYGSDGEKRKLEMDKGGGSSPKEADSTKKQKITMGFNKTFSSTKSAPEKKNPVPISIKLGAQKPRETTKNLKKASGSVAEMFNQDSDEEEEMPPEAKMRMRNIGRDTPTSAGPNSFGKTRQGFCDVKKVFERQLKKQIEETAEK